MSPGKVAVFGVPTAAGAGRSGVERGPFALREAGLLAALKDQGLAVVNLADLSLFPFRDDPEHPRARNAAGVACALRAAADEMPRALAEGFTVVLGGDCSLVAGVAAGASRFLGQPLGLVYLDADADLNTPESTPSGRLSGMALGLALGRGPSEVVTAVQPGLAPEHVSLLGFRALDAGERAAVGDLGLALPAVAVRKLGPRAAAALALDGVENGDGPILIHLDVDVIDPAEMPVKARSTPGQALSLAEVSDLLAALCASPRVRAIEVAEFDPAGDPHGLFARHLVALVVRAVTRQLKARKA
ncbi:MAG TPA: arginase family protein [Vicinamibacteria bacterium]|nr:arginase family protein [Vicinamibacteria bacterium]